MSEEKPSIWIGKNGVTDELTEEVSNQLERTQTVKIRMQKTALKTGSATDLAREIADKTGSSIIDIRGHSLTLYREKRTS